MKEHLERYGWILKILPEFLVRWAEERLKLQPKFQTMIAQEDLKVAALLESSLKPYHSRFKRHEALPEEGIPRENILSEVKTMCELERPRWEKGFVSGGIYHGDREHIDFLNQVYSLQSQSNPLHSDLFPSATKFEAEIVSMVAGFSGKGECAPDVCGTVTSGGTESILLAMKVYRDRARRIRGIKKPEIVLATTAHAAFDKASDYFGIKLIKVPVNQDFVLDPKEVRRRLGRRTIAIIGSAPAFPHGTIDPIEDLAQIAEEHGVGFHTDACLGGFVLPFAERAGLPIPKVDFRVRGVTSMSIDTHKYGFAAKGSSVVLYRNSELRREQYFTATEWPGGLYFSPTLMGSRPGALSAACWASLLSTGAVGYRDSARRLIEAGDFLKREMGKISGIRILGDPLWIIAIDSPEFDVYELMDRMSERGWSLNGLHHPPCIHIALTLRHLESGVLGRFIDDLKWSVTEVRKHVKKGGGMAPVYGMASSLPFRGLVGDLLKKTLDAIYKV
ncbi:MAG: aminotransferase class V-fold PLP-dependent enzyme [Bdellovibrionales bacterium]|nr:aminotransferase class V-fold PLP-dependent enzyme [Bdellovibrionales bacterium]